MDVGGVETAVTLLQFVTYTYLLIYLRIVKKISSSSLYLMFKHHAMKTNGGVAI
jgi:hypothetical protein